MPDEVKTSNRKRLLWIAKIILAIALCWLVLGKTQLKDKLDILDRNDNAQTLWGRLIARTDTGDWLWRDPNGVEKTIPDSQVVKTPKLNHLGQAEPSFELGLISLASKAYRSRYVWFAIVLFPLAIIIGAFRWQRLLRAGRIKLSYAETLKLTVIGNFFNQALPSLIGGDVVKAYYVMRSNPHRKTHAVMSLIADRVVGLAGLAIICLAAIVTGWNNPLVQRIKGPIFIVLAVLASILAILLVPGLARMLHLTRLIEKLPFQGFVGQLRRAARLYSAQPGVWILTLLLSILVHLILLTCIYLAGRALAPGPSYHSYLVLLPPTWMIASLPITPGAVGWMEASYQTLFGPAGVSGTAALSLSLFHRFARLLWSLPGLIVYLKGPGFHPPKDISVSRVDQILDIQSLTPNVTQSNAQESP